MLGGGLRSRIRVGVLGRFVTKGKIGVGCKILVLPGMLSWGIEPPPFLAVKEQVASHRRWVCDG